MMCHIYTLTRPFQSLLVIPVSHLTVFLGSAFVERDTTADGDFLIPLRTASGCPSLDRSSTTSCSSASATTGVMLDAIETPFRDSLPTTDGMSCISSSTYDQGSGPTPAGPSITASSANRPDGCSEFSSFTALSCSNMSTTTLDERRRRIQCRTHMTWAKVCSVLLPSWANTYLHPSLHPLTELQESKRINVRCLGNLKSHTYYRGYAGTVVRSPLHPDIHTRRRILHQG
jgi:hypothetical protein